MNRLFGQLVYPWSRFNRYDELKWFRCGREDANRILLLCLFFDDVDFGMSGLLW